MLKLTEAATAAGERLAPVSEMRFSRDGKVLATGGTDSSVCLWDVAQAGKGWKPRAIPPLGNFTVSCLAFSPDGRTLAAGAFDKKGRPNLYLIDVQAGRVVGRHRVDDEQVTAVAYSRDGGTLVTGDNFGVIRAWDAAAIRAD